jgi:hypothetical protein
MRAPSHRRRSLTAGQRALLRDSVASCVDSGRGVAASTALRSLPPRHAAQTIAAEVLRCAMPAAVGVLTNATNAGANTKPGGAGRPHAATCPDSQPRSSVRIGRAFERNIEFIEQLRGRFDREVEACHATRAFTPAR